MRVLHVDTGRQMRGGQWQVLHLLRGARHDAALLAPSGSPLATAAREAGLRVEHWKPAAIFRLARRFDLLHAHDARAHTLAAFTGAALVVARRVAFPVKTGMASRWKYSRPARYIAVSEFVKRRLKEAGIGEEKISVVHDGAPALPRSTRRGPVVAPATGDPRKGSSLAREAAQLAGVELRFSSALAGDLADACLMLYLTQEEGLGSAALLAMAAGVPVIASRIGGLPEAVQDGATGLLVGNEAGEVAAAIRCLRQNPERAEAMSEAAVRRWADAFTVDAMVERTEAVYTECLR